MRPVWRSAVRTNAVYACGAGELSRLPSPGIDGNPVTPVGAAGAGVTAGAGEGGTCAAAAAQKVAASARVITKRRARITRALTPLRGASPARVALRNVK